MEVKNFLTIKQLAKKYPCNNENSLRWHVFENTNGFCDCTRRIGRKILIEENEYLQWIDRQK